MRNTTFRLLSVLLLLFITAPTYAGSVLHIWKCSIIEGKTMAEVDAVSKAWLKAAQSMKGGDGLEVYIDIPIAAEASGDRFDFVMMAPSFDAWGVFNEGYIGSPAQKADEDFGDVARCSGSSLWYSNKME